MALLPGGRIQERFLYRHCQRVVNVCTIAVAGIRSVGTVPAGVRPEAVPSPRSPAGGQPALASAPAGGVRPVPGAAGQSGQVTGRGGYGARRSPDHLPGGTGLSGWDWRCVGVGTPAAIKELSSLVDLRQRR
jgi:hypothetical protein